MFTFFELITSIDLFHFLLFSLKTRHLTHISTSLPLYSVFVKLKRIHQTSNFRMMREDVPEWQNPNSEYTWTDAKASK
jgi:hypothetical protein